MLQALRSRRRDLIRRARQHASTSEIDPHQVVGHILHRPELAALRGDSGTGKRVILDPPAGAHDRHGGEIVGGPASAEAQGEPPTPSLWDVLHRSTHPASAPGCNGAKPAKGRGRPWRSPQHTPDPAGSPPPVSHTGRGASQIHSHQGDSSASGRWHRQPVPATSLHRPAQRRSASHQSPTVETPSGRRSDRFCCERTPGNLEATHRASNRVLGAREPHWEAAAAHR